MIKAGMTFRYSQYVASTMEMGGGLCKSDHAPYGNKPLTRYTTVYMFPFLRADLIPVLAFLLFTFIVLRMRPRRFYFIRHGETVLNAKHVRQGEEGELSEEGREQAKKVGQHFKRFPITVVVSSTYERAKETAQIIAGEIKVPVIYSELLVERRNPSEIIGKKRDLPEIRKIVDQIENAYHEDDYRYSDEENFVDLKKRARKALALLALQGEDRTVVITHHVFLKMLLAYMLHHERLHAGDFVKVSYFNFSDNATISIAEYNPWRRFSATKGWRVVSYNEQPD